MSEQIKRTDFETFTNAAGSEAHRVVVHLCDPFVFEDQECFRVAVSVACEGDAVGLEVLALDMDGNPVSFDSPLAHLENDDLMKIAGEALTLEVLRARA